ncbi:hypothetical protein TNCV_2338531 [Trichonephila clavipes]|nr:hypothetical protein TNCV_2338531 [Trichonephila clavipes]
MVMELDVEFSSTPSHERSIRLRSGNWGSQLYKVKSLPCSYKPSAVQHALGGQRCLGMISYSDIYAHETKSPIHAKAFRVHAVFAKRAHMNDATYNRIHQITLLFSSCQPFNPYVPEFM